MQGKIKRITKWIIIKIIKIGGQYVKSRRKQNTMVI